MHVETQIRRRERQHSTELSATQNSDGIPGTGEHALSVRVVRRW